MATLTTTEILSDTLEAFKVAAPMLVDPNGFATDFSSGAAVKDQQVIAHIESLPSASTYDATTGYKNGATEANTLVSDVPVTLNTHAHVPIKIDYLNAISDKKEIYARQIGNSAFVLAKSVVDAAMAKVVTANFSQKTAETIANTNRDTLGSVRKAMNAVGSAPTRGGIVSSDFFEALDQTTQITSQDYYNQRTGANPIGSLTNVAGFANIWEYPDLGTNNGSAITVSSIAEATEVVTTSADHGLAVGDPVQFTSLTGGAGLAADGTVYYVATVPTTATLTLTGVNVTTDYSAATMTRAENLSGFFFDPRSIVVASRLPNHSQQIAADLGIPAQGRFEIVEDPDTGLALLGISWQDPGTFDNYLTVTLLYGISAGKQAGSAGTICDYAGHRVVTVA